MSCVHVSVGQQILNMYSGVQYVSQYDGLFLQEEKMDTYHFFPPFVKTWSENILGTGATILRILYITTEMGHI